MPTITVRASITDATQPPTVVDALATIGCSRS
jgi:hypothetical protein